jgi:hypothetical protein
VTVHDFGWPAHAFLVMELLDGRTLRETLRAERRSIRCGRCVSRRGGGYQLPIGNSSSRI